MKTKSTKQKGKASTKSAFDCALFQLGIHFPAQEISNSVIKEASSN
jgi:hypothetical protein